MKAKQGWIELDFRLQPSGRVGKLLGFGGYGVLVSRCGSDGWSMGERKGWLSNETHGKSLAVFLVEVAGIPLTDAEHIAAESVEEWERRSAP